MYLRAVARKALISLFLAAPYGFKRRLLIKSILDPYISQNIVDGKGTQLFNSVLFELRTRCNGRCSFCAANIHTDDRQDITMSLELYRSIIDQLAELDFSGRIAFHGNSEPLLVRNLPEYVAYARRVLPRSTLQIVSNGRALNNAMGAALLEAGIDELNINVYNDDLSAPLPDRIRKFDEEVLKPFLAANPDRAKTFVYSVLKRQETAFLGNRAGTAPNKGALTKRNFRGFCQYPFKQLHLTADGRVAKCCQDFYFSDPVGDASRERIIDIWRGEPLNTLREQLLRHDRTANAMCAVCDYAGCKARNRTWTERFVREAVEVRDGLPD